MSSNDELSSDEERDFEEDEDFDDESEASEDDWMLSAKDRHLFNAVGRNDADAAEAVQQAIREGANVNAVVNYGTTTPLMKACERGNDQITRMLLDAGADSWWRRDYNGWSAITMACYFGHVSTVQLFINHDNGLLELADDDGYTPLVYAIRQRISDLVRFLLDCGADAHCVDRFGCTTLMHACRSDSLEIVRLLLAAGVDVEARDSMQRTVLHYATIDDATDRAGRSEMMRLLLAAGVDVEARDEKQQTALHYAALWHRSVSVIMLELILHHNANMFAVDSEGKTPFDLACLHLGRLDVDIYVLLAVFGSRLTQDHGSIALHEVLKVAEYSFAEAEEFHPPLNPLQIILPLGRLTLEHLCTLLHYLDPELICNRDDTGKLPIHIACQTNAPVEVLALILELDPTTLHIADFTSALPMHLLCGTTSATEYASVRYLVEQGGVGTLAARNQQGASPLHVLCESTNPPLRAVQYLIQSFPGSVAVQSNAGDYPFMVAAAAESSSASVSVIYELVRANPGLVVPR